VGAGCVFASRCPLVIEKCRTSEPPLFTVEPGRVSRCYRWTEAENDDGTVDDSPAAAPAAEPTDASPAEPVVSLQHVSKTFPGGVHALTDVSLDIAAGQTLGLVGESGSGKTTLARVLLGLIPPDQGSVVNLGGTALAPSARRRPRAQLRALQIVFQNPDSALNRRHPVRRIISQPLARLAGLSGAVLEARLSELVTQVRLEQRHLLLRPAQLSGGLKQRVAIARAFGGGPRVVVCDEPTSALDVSVQAMVLKLLVRLRRERDVSQLFVSHDLNVVRLICDRIAVMYRGHIVEQGATAAIFRAPCHPYTQALLAASPRLPGAARPSTPDGVR
jgi:peptide/nickel transport system ATP-binding protein